MSASFAGLVRIDPGADSPVRCERPLTDPLLLERLLRGRPLGGVPALLGSVFALCADMHRLTAQRALDVAQGFPFEAARAAYELGHARYATLREHVQRLALDLPVRAPQNGAASDPRWLRGLPAHRVSPEASAAAGARVQSSLAEATAELVQFVEARLLGMSSARFAERFPPCSPDAIAAWACAFASDQPAAAWLARAHTQSAHIPVHWHALPLAQDPDRGARLLAAALRNDPAFARRPNWEGQAVETGPFSRAAWPDSAPRPSSLWGLLASRMTDLHALCTPLPWLRLGAVATGPGEALAYTEMARGLLVHWVKLDGAASGEPVIAAYQVVAPTDWSFHAQGALARALRKGAEPGHTRLLVAAFDPCVDVDIAGESGSSDARGPAHA
jgi:hypothetical protein